MPDTFVKIASVTVGSGGASSIDFTSIPSTYTDLLVKISTRANTGSAGGYQSYIKFNSDSGSNYNWKNLIGYAGTSVTSQNPGTSDTGMRIYISNASGDTTNTFSNAEIYVPNYTGSTYKSVSADSVAENNGTSGFLDIAAGIWSSTSAITSINLYMSGANFVQYSTATLYGIKNS